MSIEISKDEIKWVEGYDEKGGLHHVITSTKLRDRYFLYLYRNGKIEKKLSAPSPEKFEKYI